MTEKILITAALPYANGAIHFGHLAGAYLPADCYARYQRRLGNEVCFICGSDEYGVAISLSAELAKRTPQEHVDIFHKKNEELFARVGMSFDYYGRTSHPEHAHTTQEFFKVLKRKGLVKQMESEQLFSEEDGQFYADRYVVGECPRCGFLAARGDECTKCGASYEAIELKNPKTKIGGRALQKKKTTHWYLLLDAQKEKLLQWLSSRQWKPNVLNFVKHYASELKPRAITRDMKWGIPVPGEPEGKVFYVWFDAPIGYISATKEWAKLQGNSELWKEYWLNPKTKFVQFIGKDNIPFHAVIFPAMLMGQDESYKLVDELPANEFYTLAGKQFSKSDGWYIDVESFLNTYSQDQLRYAILSNAPETQDSEFTWKDFQSRSNSDLGGKFGNFIHRSLVFLHQQCHGAVPKRSQLSQSDCELLEKISLITKDFSDNLDQFRVRRACQCLMELCQVANGYFDQSKPWALAKDPSQRERLETCLSLCLEVVLKLAILSEPILPNASQTILRILGVEKRLENLSWNERLTYQLPEGHVVQVSVPLFKKVEDSEIVLEEEKLKQLSK